MGEKAVRPVVGTGQEVSVYWTDSRRGLIVVGDRTGVTEIAREVGLAEDAPVAVSAEQWAVALWGASASTFAERFEPHVSVNGRETDELVNELVGF